MKYIVRRDTKTGSWAAWDDVGARRTSDADSSREILDILRNRWESSDASLNVFEDEDSFSVSF